jgi:hypothetical protein
MGYVTITDAIKATSVRHKRTDASGYRGDYAYGDNKKYS